MPNFDINQLSTAISLFHYANLYIRVLSDEHMKKMFFLLVLLSALLFSTAHVSAEFSVIEKRDRGSVIISELDNPATFEFVIQNQGGAEDAEIYSLTGVSMTPRGNFEIPSGNSTLNVQAFVPANQRRVAGQYIFEYQIKGQSSGIVRDNLAVTIVNLKDTLSIEAASFRPNTEQLRLVIKNRQNTNLDTVNLKLSSEFFTSEQTISLKPRETITVTVPIERTKAKTLAAGKYTLKGDIGLGSASATIESILDYLEDKDIAIFTRSSGFLVRTSDITRTNAGNVPITDTIESSRDIVTRLFTSHTREPLVVERNALSVDYLWQKELQPGESWTLTTTTNYTFPFLLLLLVVACIYLVYRYSRTQVVAHKQVTHVRTKSGHFAVKVQIAVRSRTDVRNIQVIERVPGMMKLYAKFGTQPHKLDTTTRRLFWNIEHLRAGETRVISYIIYSNMRVVGRLEFAPALIVFEHGNALHEVPSNRAFFFAETVRVAE
jgi:hypothetical protein